ncbi:MAG TPA: hypothetical protein VFJ51_00375 [Nitrososphaeraceae archaeon]|nr:hypothetical protein [Nitrososphaeraceae archaeon]
MGSALVKNAIIQSGWDIHPNVTNIERIGNNNSIFKRDQPLIKKPVYDVLGYSTSIAVKMMVEILLWHSDKGKIIFSP